MAQPQPPAAGPSGPTLALTPSVVSKLKPSRIFKSHIEPSPNPRETRHITGLSFNDSAEHIITSAEDESFRLYNARTGKHSKTFWSKKYGVVLPRFMHAKNMLVHASTKEDDSLRYHSLHDNKYMTYFKGHTDRVTGLEVSPIDDGFISAAKDRTVRLWDTRTQTCRGLLNLPTPDPVIAYDAGGLVFAVAVNGFQRILLYDQANYDKAPFLTITMDDPELARISYPPRPIYTTSLKFSANGKWILVGTSGDAHYVLDAYNGVMMFKLVGHIGLERRSTEEKRGVLAVRGISGEEVGWTPDSKFVVAGSLDGAVLFWDIGSASDGLSSDTPVVVKTLQPMVKLDGHSGVPARCVAFNPRFGMMATASTELAFWLPDPSGDVDEIAKEMLTKKK